MIITGHIAKLEKSWINCCFK